MRFEKQTFAGADTVVTLDYNEFVDCVFNGCWIEYFGGAYSFKNPTFTNVRFRTYDAAARTLMYLRDLRTMFGEKVVMDMVNSTDTPAPAPGTKGG